MQTYFADYLRILQNCHNDIHRALDGLSPEALDWIPGKDMNSISVLVFHLTGAERFWIGDVAMQETSNRDRDAEFKVHEVGLDALKKRLDDSLEYARVALERLSLPDLEVSRTSPRDGREFTIGWSLLHALEHTALHLGHIEIARQLWEQKEGIP